MAAGTLAVAMVAASALVLGPTAQVARADVVAPSPVQVPGSVLSSAGTLSDAGWNSVLQQATGKVGAGYTLPSQVSETTSLGGKAAVSGPAGAAGGAVAGLMALMQGMEMGNSIAYATGISENNSWQCDMREAVTGSACKIAAAETYVANSDVVMRVPGWAVSPPLVGINGNSGWAVSNDGRWTLGEVTASPAYGDKSSTLAVTVNASISGSCSRQYASGWGPALSAIVYFTDGSSSATQSLNTYSGPLGANCATPSGALSFSLVNGAGKAFDHLQFRNTNGTTASGAPGSVIWYPTGNPARPPDVVANPQRTWVTNWKCSDGSVGSASSPSFTETDPEWPGFPQAECDGSAVTSVKIVEQKAGSSDTTTMWTWDAGQAQKDWASSDCARASSPCTLLLTRTDAQTGTRISCFDNPSVCVDWWTETQQATSTTSDYQCTYGAQTLALSECSVYSQLFKTGEYANPTTGSAPAPSNPSEPQQDDTCPPPFTWTSMINPWWYYKGAVCAMQKVFVPSTALQTSKVTTAWNASALGQVGGVVSNLGAGFAAIGGGECGVITDSEPVPLLGWHLVVDTCAWPWSAAGPLKRIIGIAFLLGAIVIGVRTVLRIIRADVVVDGGEK